MKNKKQILFAVIIFMALPLLFPSNLFSQNGMIEMYNSKRIDGCKDFHCTKCNNRENCSLNMNCSIKNCGHKHGAVLCGDEAILFYLRSSNGYTNKNGDKDCEARAIATSERLNSSMMMMMNHEKCTFIVRNESGDPLEGNENPTIWMEMKDGHNMKIVTITNSDMRGYKARAKMLSFSKMAKESGSITKKMVAYWWASNIEDHFTMMVLNKEPSLTTNTHCGKVLLKVWREAKKIVPKGKISMKTFSIVIHNLSVEEKRHLQFAAQIIPKNFEPIMR